MMKMQITLVWCSIVVVLLTAGTTGAQVTFSGQIIDEEARPIAGAEVALYEMTGGVGTPSGYEAKWIESMTTGPDGAFSFEAEAIETYRDVMVVAHKEGLALGWGSWTMREDQQYDICLTEPRQLSGVVVDTQNQPLPGVTVFVAAGRIGTRADGEHYLISPLARRLLVTQTDASGRFVLDGLSDDTRFELGAEKARYATMATIDRSTRTEALRFAPGASDVKLTLEPEARIEGRVVGQDGAALEGLPVIIRGERLVPYLPPKPVDSQRDGTFRFHGLPADTYIIGLAVPEEELAEWVATPVRVTVESGQTETDVAVKAGKGGLVELIITDTGSGRPIAQARIDTRRVEDGHWFHAVSDDNGIARLRLSPGSYQYTTAAKAGYTRDPEGRPLEITEGQIQRVSLPLKAAPKIAGVIRDRDGRPVAGATVSILPASYSETVSDTQGRYEMIWDPSMWIERDITFCLLARHVERNLAVAVEMGAETQSLDVTLQPGMTLSGKVVGSGGRDLAGVRIAPSLNMSNWGAPLTRESMRSEADGTFVVAGLPRDQRYSINAMTDGYGSISHHIEAELTQAERVDVGTLVLPMANLSVSGQVVDIDGNPVAGAHLSSSGWQGQSIANAVANGEGRFVVEGVCAGQVDLDARGVRDGRALSGRMRAEGGASGVRIVLREGRSPIQYHRSETYDEIVASSGRVIVGIAVDESGAPVAGVPVGVCCHKRIREDGRMSWLYSSFPTLRDTTDGQGRFAIVLEEDGEYNLLFSPARHAAKIVYDVPVNTKDLKVTLEAGGTLEGRLLRLDGAKKVPIPHAEVKLEQTDRSSYTHLGFDRDRTTRTDEQGRFRFEHIQTGVRPDSSRMETQWSPIPRVWQVVYGDTTHTFAFTDGSTIEDFELLVKPDIETAAPLTGRPLPQFDGITIDLGQEQIEDKAVLVCFFDYQQRPSRNTVMQLAGQAESFQQKGVVVAAIQTSPLDRTTLDTWVRDNNVPFPIGTITADVEVTRAVWHVKSLPWLVLTDEEHVVTAEGFGLNELDEMLKRRVGP